MTPRFPFPAATPRILIVRLSAIGDVVHGLPVLNALRDHFPAAFLAWAVEERGAPLLRGHKALDELIVLPRGWLKSPAAVWRLRRRLRDLRFDAAIDVQGLTKSAVAARLSGAQRRIGFDDEKGRELSRWLNNVRVRADARHIIDCNLRLLEPLGVRAPDVRYDVPERREDGAWADRTAAQLGLAAGYAMINPGAGSVSRLWPPDRFAAVARHLAAAWRLPSLAMWAGEKERGWAEAIAAGSQGAAAVCPPTTLLQLTALARRARLFVSSCTGPLHIAEAVGTPCVGLFGPWPAERNGPYGPPHIALQQRRFEGSTRQRRTAPKEIMEAIAADMVCAACDRILAPVAARAA